MKRIFFKKTEQLDANKSLLEFSNIEYIVLLRKKEMSQLKGGDGEDQADNDYGLG